MPATSPAALLSGVNSTPTEAPSTSRLYTERTVADLLGVTTRTLQRWRITGDGPAWVRCGPRMVRYPEAAVSAWAAGRTYAHRAAELSAEGA